MFSRRRLMLLSLSALLGSSGARATPALQHAMQRARAMRDAAVRAGDQPYGAVVLRGDQIGERWGHVIHFA